MISCPHFTPRAKDGGSCTLGMYGGKPSLGVCKNCIAKGQNNPEHAKDMEAIYEKAWPSGARRISGCCDRADQA